MNEHLLQVPDGNKTEGAAIDMSGFEFSTGGSGHVDPGVYEAKVTDARWVPKKGRSGRNLKLTWKVTAPSKQAGVQVVVFHPAPAGQTGDEAVEVGVRMFKNAVATIADAGGKLKDFRDKGKVKIPPGWFEGKTGHLRLDDDMDDRGNVRSSITRYVAKKEFEENPGPDGGGIDDAPDMDASSTPTQDVEPDLGTSSGNGAGSTPEPATDEVADLMDIPGL